jgi:K+-sensing histidine kinase KdpD
MTLSRDARGAAFALAIVLSVLSELVKSWVMTTIGADLGYTLAWAAVIIPVIVGGLLPGLLASTIIVGFEVFQPVPLGSPLATVEGQLKLAVFFLASAVVSILGDVSLYRRLAAERARSSEHAALLAAEQGRQRLGLLVEAGQVLSTSLDYDQTLLALGRLAIPMLGDYCVLDVVEGERVRRLVATTMPGQDDVVHGLQEHPVDLTSENPVAVTIRTGKTTVLAPDDALLTRVALDASHLDAMRRSGFREVLIVALRSPERSLGSLMFATTRTDRHYDGDDITVAQVLAQRATRAIENARLWRELRRLASHERERAAELASVIGAIGEGIVSFDADGRVRSHNAAAVRMLGGAPRDHADVARRLAPGAALPELGIETGPTEYQLSKPPHPWLEIATYSLRGGDEGGPGGTVMILRDVTAFREGQSLREAFLSLLSHELRTPITSIYAASTVLGKRGDNLEPATRAEILTDIVAESDRLFRLIEDLLVLARFDEGLELVGEPSLLQRVVPAVVESERHRWPQAEFTVHSGRDLPAVGGDETSIAQIVRNLLSNAVKYGPVGQEVEIRIDDEADGVAVRVLDRGPGIKVVEAEDLFTPFYRSPSTAAVAGGAGIGLFVCRRLIGAMGGRIWAAARTDGAGGSEFGFWLPRYESVPDDETGGHRRGSAPTPVELTPAGQGPPPA